ncbi:hypothetical protein T484DRAFT_1813835 [Baffinella frigidus]|nr:hypothetical protein T484DRAFT_1813835 [Cryptophyta sp. CCMP2293]
MREGEIGSWGLVGFCEAFCSGEWAVRGVGGSVEDDATVKCWGWNEHGKLGYGDKIDRGDGTHKDHSAAYHHSGAVSHHHLTHAAHHGTAYHSADHAGAYERHARAPALER